MAFIQYRNDADQVVIITLDATEREEHSGTAIVSEHPIESGGNVTDHVRAENDMLALDVIISNTPLTENSQNDYNLAPSHLDGARGSVQSAGVFFSSPQRRVGGPRLLVEGSPPLSIRDIGPAVGLGANLGGIGPVGGVGFTAATAVDIIPAIAPVWQATQEIIPESTKDQGIKVLRFDGEFDRVQAVYNALNDLRRTGQVVEIVTGLRAYENMVLEGVNCQRDATTGDSMRGSLFARQIRRVDSQTVQVTAPLEPRGQKQSKRGKQVPAPASAPEANRSQDWIQSIFPSLESF